MNKIMYEQVDLTGNSPVNMKWSKYPHFSYPWHCHNEFEILYILNSTGTRFVADSIEPFQVGDLVFLGSNVPHFWQSDPQYFENNPNLEVEVIVIQFSESFMMQAIANYPEMAHIYKLFTQAGRGIRFLPPESDKIGKKIKALWNASPFSRIVGLLGILNEMAMAKQSKLLASELNQKLNIVKDDRLEKILYYLNQSFTQKITLSELSARFNMNQTALCRYFKEKTGIPLIGYVNKLRVGYACKLLHDRNLPISQICEICGFNNLSNFNRVFKSITKHTPTVYAKNLK
jgi:AraC-like DNA-binding protein